MRFILFSLFLIPLAVLAQDNGFSSFKSNTTNQRANSNALLNDYDVKFYGLDIIADNLSTYVEGNVTVIAQVRGSSFNEFVLELVDVMIVDSVIIDDQLTTFVHSNEEVSIAMPQTLTEGAIFNAKVYYHGDPQTGGFFSGISNDTSPSWGNQITWTLSEPLNAKQWWPTKQILEDKADSVHVFITVPDHLKVGSNGLLTNEVSLPDGKKRYEWKTKYPIAYYLISIAIGEYVEYITYANVEGYPAIPIQNYIYNNPDCLPYYKNDLDEMASLVELFSDLYGIYPFYEEKYGHAMAPFSGGMEHQTMTTLGIFNFTLDAHELGHQWFGDNVTCATWQDIWVNEGFARYSEYLAQEYLHSKAEADAWIKEEYAAVKQTQGTVYIPENEAEDENRIFNFELTYQKGGSIVHMIRNIINNDELFFTVLKEYQIKFKDSTATGDDFRAVLEEQTGIDFSDFFEDWYYGSGYPSYTTNWGYYGDTLYVEQHQVTLSGTNPLFETPLEYQIKFDNGDSLFRISQTANDQSFKFYISREVVGLIADPNQWLIKNTFVKKSITEPETPVVTSIDEINSSFNVYPNPGEGLFYILNLKQDTGLSVRNPNGQLLLKEQIQNETYLLDLTGQPAGIYILQFVNENGIITKKLVLE